uniref:Ig-like domain-containing protein n=1 Tax=Bracon brevicornis TaxID=1563983 RepID=A0A6V7J286_9HYME
MGKYNFSPSQIFNVDVTGISVVPDAVPVVAEKGQKRVGPIASGERGKNVTVICADSAAGGYVPPMFVFPRQRMTPALQNGGPPGAAYHCSANGYSNPTLFLMWLKHFKGHTHSSKENPVVIILDNHDSHISLESYQFCRDNGIVLVSLPSHTSHRMQPLDVSFFGPLKKAIKKQTDSFLKQNMGKRITVYEIASVFHHAYISVASIENAVSGFEASGNWPLNRNKLTGEAFAPADIFKSMADKLASTLTFDYIGSDPVTMDVPVPFQQDVPFDILIPLSSEHESAQGASNNDPETPAGTCEEDVQAAEIRDINDNSISDILGHAKGPSDDSTIKDVTASPSLTQTAQKCNDEIGPSLTDVATPRTSKSTNIRSSRSTSRLNKLSESTQRAIQLAQQHHLRTLSASSSPETSGPQDPTPASTLHEPAPPESQPVTPKTNASRILQSLSNTSSPSQCHHRATTPSLITPGISQLLSSTSHLSHYLKPFSPSMGQFQTPPIIVVNLQSPLSTAEQLIPLSNEKSPIPKGRKKQHSTVLTSSPMKESLENKKRKRDEREQKTEDNKFKRIRMKIEKSSDVNRDTEQSTQVQPPRTKAKAARRKFSGKQTNKDSVCAVC